MERLLLESFLEAVRNSVGANLWKIFWVKEDTGNVRDVLEDGNLSCAYFVTSLLKLFNHLKEVHFTVDSAVKAMKEEGWEEVAKENLHLGDVLVWEEKQEKECNVPHRHIGFYVGNNQAVSNSSKKKCPIEHHYTYKGKRKIILVLRRGGSV